MRRPDIGLIATKDTAVAVCALVCVVIPDGATESFLCVAVGIPAADVNTEKLLIFRAVAAKATRKGTLRTFGTLHPPATNHLSKERCVGFSGSLRSHSNG